MMREEEKDGDWRENARNMMIKEETWCERNGIGRN